MKKPSKSVRIPLLSVLTIVTLLASACGARDAELSRDSATTTLTGSLEFAGLEHTAVGKAALRFDEDRLVVAGLGSSGRDGVAVEVGDLAFWEGHLIAFDGATPTGAALEMRVTGRVDGSAGRPVLAVQTRHTGKSLAFVVDNTPLRARAHTVRVFDGKQLMGEVQVNAGRVGFDVSDLDARTGERGTSGPSLTPQAIKFTPTGIKFEFWKRNRQVAESLTFGTNVAVSLDGETYRGDRLTIEPADHPAEVDGFESAVIAATGMNEFVILGEETTMPPVEFANLRHSARGDAMLWVEDRVLEITGFGTSGRDGVAIALGRAKAWEAQLRFDAEPDAVLTFTALQDTERGPVPASSLILRNIDGAWGLSPSFGSASYDAALFAGDTLVRRDGGLPNGAQAVGWLEELFCLLEGGAFCQLTIEFHQNADGACVWELTLAEPVVLETRGSVTKGDRIVFNENHEAHGHRHEAMVFPEMRVDAARVASIEVLDEAVEPAASP